MAENYDALASDYDWLFSDEMLVSGLAITQPATAGLLSQLGSDHRVLDAACGTGVDTAVLARKGLSMWAADKSPTMIEHARLRFASEGLAIPLLQGEWAQLPDIAEERFDAVLCIGNSLVHAAGKNEMARALMGLRGVLSAPDGSMVRLSNWRHRVWQPAADQVGLPPTATPYALRHTAASLMAQQGVPVSTAAAALGHDPAIFLRTYAHLYPGDLRTAADAMDSARSAARRGSKNLTRLLNNRSGRKSPSANSARSSRVDSAGMGISTNDPQAPTGS